MSKLRKFLAAWFDGIGYIAAGRISGDSSHYDINSIDVFFAKAKRLWDQLTLREQLQWYKELSFEDHMNYNEREFIRYITKKAA